MAGFAGRDLLFCVVLLLFCKMLVDKCHADKDSGGSNRMSIGGLILMPVSAPPVGSQERLG
jgi:hypothetical protein